MKNLIIISCFFTLLLSSCYPYFVVQTNAGKNISDTGNQYVYENDTVKVTYDLWEKNGAMLFSVYNKLDVPIFVDWKNSAFIINDNKYDYWSDRQVAVGHSRKRHVYGYTYGDENSVSVKDARVTEIPPYSKTSRKADNPIMDPAHIGAGQLQSFRNFLALSMTEDLVKETYVDNRFGVEGYKRSGSILEVDQRNFYLKRKRG